MILESKACYELRSHTSLPRGYSPRWCICVQSLHCRWLMGGPRVYSAGESLLIQGFGGLLVCKVLISYDLWQDGFLNRLSIKQGTPQFWPGRSFFFLC